VGGKVITPDSSPTAYLYFCRVDAFGQSISYGEIFDPAGDLFRIAAAPPQTRGALRLEASIPAYNDRDVPIDSLIGLRFSTRIEAKSANVQTVQLSGPDGNLVLAAVVPAEDGMLVFVTPASALSLDSSYTISIRGVTDAAGTALPDTYIRFTTVGKKDAPKDDQTFQS